MTSASALGSRVVVILALAASLGGCVGQGADRGDTSVTSNRGNTADHSAGTTERVTVRLLRATDIEYYLVTSGGIDSKQWRRRWANLQENKPQDNAADPAANPDTNPSPLPPLGTVPPPLTRGPYAESAANSSLPPEDDRSESARFQRRMAAERWNVAPDESPLAVAAAIQVVGFLADKAMDRVAAYLRDHAAAHVAEYEGFERESKFWSGGMEPEFAGWEVRRERVSTGHRFAQTTDDVIVHAVFLIIPADGPPGGKVEAHNNHSFMLVRPVYFRDDAPRAITSGDDKFHVQMETKLERVFVNNQGAIEAETVLDDALLIANYGDSKPGSNPALISRDELNYESQWFGARPIEGDALTPTNLTITVTEQDAGKAAKRLEAIAGFLDKQKPQVVELVKTKLTEAAQ